MNGNHYRGADLAGRDFAGADLRGANFVGANLTKANFAQARLENADLSQARLLGANFVGAQLAGARFHRAQLAGASCDPGALRPCARRFAHDRRRHRIRFTVTPPAIPRLAQRRHVVNIYAKFQHEFVLSAKHTLVWQRNKNFLP